MMGFEKTHLRGLQVRFLYALTMLQKVIESII